jgi:hypothetical protein
VQLGISQGYVLLYLVLAPAEILLPMTDDLVTKDFSCCERFALILVLIKLLCGDCLKNDSTTPSICLKTGRSMWSW